MLSGVRKLLKAKDGMAAVEFALIAPVLGTSIPKRAAAKGLVEYHLTQLRDFATDNHKSVDDRPFGGGPGMVLMCQTMFDAVEHIERQ